MANFLKINLSIILFLIFLITLVNCVPTSVLVNTKDVKNNPKVKRSSTLSLSDSSSTLTTNHKSDLGSHHASAEHTDEKSSDLLFGANKGMMSSINEPKSTPKKRGVNSQLLYNDIFNSLPITTDNMIGAPNGVWSDEIDPPIMYQDLQDFEDYPRGTYRIKPYDNLQSILNAETYSEPIALPLQYNTYRYYGDRKKRSNLKNPYSLRLKRESKLSPADMLALVALVEAGERNREDAENESVSSNDYSRPGYLIPYGGQIDDDISEYNGNLWSNNPSLDYYGMPYNLNSLSKYDTIKDQRLEPNYFPSKRFMIAKKKRSLGYFLNDPVGHPSILYDNRYSLPSSSSASTELLGKGLKKHQKYF